MKEIGRVAWSGRVWDQKTGLLISCGQNVDDVAAIEREIRSLKLPACLRHGFRFAGRRIVPIW